MELIVCGKESKFRGSISIVCADNLASWNIGGYKALASALRKYQFCMAVADDMKSKVISSPYRVHLVQPFKSIKNTIPCSECSVINNLFPLSHFNSFYQRISNLKVEIPIQLIVPN